MAKTVHLIRHGESTFNAHTALHDEDPMHFDAPLSPKGEQQVQLLHDTVADMSVDLVVTSPFRRTLQTALTAFASHNTPVLVETLHREYLYSSCDVGTAPAELSKDFPELDFDHLDDPWWYVEDGHEGPFAREPHGMAVSRARRFREWLTLRGEGSIAVVGHGSFFEMMIGRYIDNVEIAEFQP